MLTDVCHCLCHQSYCNEKKVQFTLTHYVGLYVAEYHYFYLFCFVVKGCA